MSDTRTEVVSTSINGDVGPEDEITVRFSEPVDIDTASAGIYVIPDVRGDLEFDADGRTATFRCAAPMFEGRHTLVVDEVLNRRGSRIDSVRIPFTVFGRERTELPVPDEHVVLARSTTELEMLDRRLTVAKVLDSDSDEGYEVAIDEIGAEVDHEELFAEDERVYRHKYGRIHPTLYERLREAGDRPLSVALWLDVREERPDKAAFDVEELDEEPVELVEYRERIDEAREGMRERLKRYDIELREEDLGSIAPVVLFEATAEQIREVADFDDIGGLYLYEEEGIDDLSSSMRVSNADDVVNTQGWTGNGSRVAVWERGPDDTSELDIEDEYSSSGGTSAHARLVSAIIKNAEDEAPNGYAPECELYSANSYSNAALRWAVDDARCHVISQSFHRNSEQTSPALSLDDRLKDYLAVHYPYPTIVQAAGNGGSSEYVNHKGYNSMNAANHNDSASGIAGSSVFRNPSSRHDDRELPELSANGTGVGAVGLRMSGTSFAAPAVAGSVALLQDISGTLRYWPEGSRAILMAGATRNITGGTWIGDLQSGVDGVDGAGALDIEEAGRIVRTRQRRNNNATMRGWDIGTLRSRDFDSRRRSMFEYRVGVPRRGRERVKVALAWNSDVTSFFGVPIASTLDLDFDLLVHDSSGRFVASSSSWDNSYEIAEFEGEPGETYTVTVRRWSGTDRSWYGIAWTVY